MKIIVIVIGYIGVVTGACLSNVGIVVTCVDIEQKKIDGLKKGMLPNYEPRLNEIVDRNYANGRLDFSTELSEAIHGTDNLALTMEWTKFHVPNWKKVGTSMKTRVVFDGRNLYRSAIVAEASFDYYRIEIGENIAVKA